MKKIDRISYKKTEERKIRVVQDMEFESNFDKEVKNMLGSKKQNAKNEQ